MPALGSSRWLSANLGQASATLPAAMRSRACVKRPSAAAWSCADWARAAAGRHAKATKATTAAARDVLTMRTMIGGPSASGQFTELYSSSRNGWLPVGVLARTMTLMRALALGVLLLVPLACDRGAPPPQAPPPPLAVAPPPAPPAPRLPHLGGRRRAPARRLARGRRRPHRPPPTTRRGCVGRGSTSPAPSRPPRSRSASPIARPNDEPSRPRGAARLPLWADHWTAYWDDVWMGRDAKGQEVDRGAFRAWLHDVLARNLPWERGRHAAPDGHRPEQRGRPTARGVRERRHRGRSGWRERRGQLDAQVRGDPARHGGHGVAHAARRPDPVRAVPRPQDGEVDAEGLPAGRRRLRAHGPRADRPRQGDGRGEARRAARPRAAGDALREDGGPGRRDEGAAGRARWDGPHGGTGHRARRARAVGHRAPERVVRARLREPHVGPLPRTRLRRSGGRPPPVEPLRRAGGARRARGGLRRERLRREAPGACRRRHGGLRALRRPARRGHARRPIRTRSSGSASA